MRAMLSRPPQALPRPGAISSWLFAVAALVFVMVVVGGITRLTESGLSMVRWEPISGIVPPMGEAQWMAEFDAYRATPEYRQVNRGMTLEEFKGIFFWEYVHRVLGRLIGLAFALPLLWFWWRRAIPRGYGWKLVALLVLGGLQGFIGWWMVASGLVDQPEVSHIRLAIHLLTALTILGGLVWVALDLRHGTSHIPVLGSWTLSVLFLQLLFGAYVAGLEAGFAFNTWPLMGDEFFPSGMPMLEPWLANFVDNPVMVQFVHRWLAFVVAGLAFALAARAWLQRLHIEAALLVFLITLQILLGIFTLLSGVELWIAVAHQAVAALVVAATVLAAHRMGERREPRRSVEPARPLNIDGQPSSAGAQA